MKCEEMKKLAEINVSMPELHNTCLQMLAPLPYYHVVNKNGGSIPRWCPLKVG